MEKSMKKTVVILLATLTLSAWSQTYVAPHVTKNGTYVEGHYRSNPNNTERDNYGSKGNYNPYSGQEGSRTPKEDKPDYLTPHSYGQKECGYTSTGRYICR